MSNENISQKHVFICIYFSNGIEYVGLQPYTFYV